jgi:hypothetical protein
LVRKHFSERAHPLSFFRRHLRRRLRIDRSIKVRHVTLTAAVGYILA